MKRIISVILCFVMSFSLMLPAFATEAEPERIVVEVDTMADIDEFYKTPEYDNTKRYSFIIKYHPMPRIPCTNCGAAAWTGSEYRVDEVDVFAEQCPSGAGLGSDIVVVYHYHYVERCRNCGYEIVHDEHFFKINCQLQDAFFPDYEAWNGNTEENSDIHEIKSKYYWAYQKYPW